MGVDELLGALKRDLEDAERYAREIDYDAFVRSRDQQNMVLFALYRVIQSVIDLTNALVAEHQLGVPQSYKEGIDFLVKGGLIDGSLASDLEGWVGLRNVIAHIYRKLDLDTLYAALTGEIGSLRRFLERAEALVVKG